MNTYLEAFKHVNSSIKQLLAEELCEINSPEIKKSAQKLEEKVQPCIQEIAKAASILEESLYSCLKCLEEAEEILESKKRIIEVPSHEILEQIGDCTGLHGQLKPMAEKAKENLYQEALESWKQKFDKITNKHFVDSENKIRQGLGWKSKEKYIQEIIDFISSYSDFLDTNIKIQLKEIFNHSKDSILTIKNNKHITLFDDHSRLKIELEFNTRLEHLESRFNDHISNLENGKFLVDIKASSNSKLAKWKKRKDWNDILHREVL